MLGLSLAGIQKVGGPSPRWVQNLPLLDGSPTARMHPKMNDLDRVLRWRSGTTWGLVNEDRSAWSEDVLADEEESLMDPVDEADEIAFVIAARLRCIPAGEERDEAMRRLLEVLDIRP